MSDPIPQFDLVGPKVDDDVRRLIRRYGADEVRKAVKGQTAGKRGRVPVSDWPNLLDILREDARTWLEGRDPFKTRSNRSIALTFAANAPPHNREAIYGRMMRKLRERRRYYTLVDAEHLSHTEYSYADNLRAIAELRRVNFMRNHWDRLSDSREAAVCDYKSKFGEPPGTMTMQELVVEASRTVVAVPASGNVFQILTGEPR